MPRLRGCWGTAGCRAYVDATPVSYHVSQDSRHLDFNHKKLANARNTENLRQNERLPKPDSLQGLTPRVRCGGAGRD